MPIPPIEHASFTNLGLLLVTVTSTFVALSSGVHYLRTMIGWK